MATVGDKVYARIPFGYGKYRDRGEVFILTNSRNNGKLEGLRYFLPFNPKEHKEISCDKCGRKFISMSFLDQHNRKRSCDDDSATPTRLETAELIGADPDKFKMIDDEGGAPQRATDVSGRL